MHKRWISLLMAAILTVTIVFPGQAIAVATDTQENDATVEVVEATDATEASNPTEATDATEPSDPTEATDATEPSDPTEATDATEPSDSTEAVDETEPSDPTEATNVTEPSDPTEATDATEPSDPTEATGATVPSDPTEATDATEPNDPTEATDVIEPNDPTEATDVTEPIDSTETTDVTDSEEHIDPADVVPDWIDDALLDGGISVASLLPIAEKKAYLVIGNHDGVDISQVPLDWILDSLMDSNGNPIEIDDDAKIAWCYCKDRDGSTITDDYYLIEEGGTVDLSIYEEYDRYTLEMIVGDGNQLNPKNERYIVTVYLADTVSGLRTYEIYTQDADGTRHKVVPDDQYATSTTISGMTSANRVFVVSEHVDGTEYYLGINDPIDEHPFIQCDVMDYADYFGFMMGQAFGFEYEYTNLADKFVNVDMRKTDAGYKNNWDVPEVTEDSYDITKTFALLYKNSTTGEVLTSELITFTVTNALPRFEDNAFDPSTAESVKLTSTSHVSLNEIKGPFDITEDDITQIRRVILNEGYPADAEYRYALYAKSPIWEDANDHVVKATIGWYDSLESAAEAEDISDQLLPKSNATGEVGYKANYNIANGGVQVSIFFDDGSLYKFLIVFQEYDKDADLDYMREFTEKPIIGEADPWVRITGATSKDGTVYSAENHNAYIVENGKAINMDTSYGYGNQTIFINDNNVDLTQLHPTIWKANDDRIKIYVNGVPYNEGDYIDCTKTVTFTAIIDGHQKTYNVNFMKKASGPSLYVFGSTTREVFLDEYFEKKHDILIANMGDEELTGLRVELNATNCQLDEYWTIGGEGNDTLAPFTATSSDTEYGELNNLAKIRLVPVAKEDIVGNGEIEGTLKIYADVQQEPLAVITLTGQALNPQITTNQESFASYKAVQYVPYAYVITTSSMHDWIDTSFTMTGDLPVGMEFYPETGEIYGVPQETGEFNIHIEASFESETSGFDSSSIDLKLTVLDNTNENVYEASDANYQIKQHIGTQTGTYDFVLETIEDTVFTSYGEYGEFVNIWLNGEELVKDVDYTKEEGSTKITIKSLTIENKANDDGSENTIAMEFRTDTDGDGSPDADGDLNRTAQNFKIVSTSTNDDDTNNTDNTNNSNGDTGNVGDTENVDNTGNIDNIGNGGNTDGNAGDADNGDNKTDTTTNQDLTCIFHMIDADSNPIADLSLELHSTPQFGTTNSSGNITFSTVEFGKHTLYVKNQNGDTTASKSFELIAGDDVSVNGDQITAAAGTTIVLTIQYDGSELSLLSAEQSGAPKTGDDSASELWIILLGVSVAGLLAIKMLNKKIAHI